MQQKCVNIEFIQRGPFLCAELTGPGGTERLPLAAINVSIANDYPKVREGFIEMCRQIAAALIEDAGGKVASFTSVPVSEMN